MNRIRQLRQELDMKQSELAAKMKVRQTTISNWETDRTEPDTASLQKMAEIFDTTIDYILGNSLSRKGSTRKGIRIPVFGAVAAGIPIEAIEDIVDYEEIEPELAATGEYFGLRIKGSSMEPRICEGDVVIVRKQEDADTGDVAIVMVNGYDATCKKLKKEAHGLTLIPNNPAYEAKYYSAEEIASLPVRIIGKVVELRGKF